MVDREKVIKGLERCKLYNKVNCDKCPYDYNGRGNGKSECTAELASDALALLKEQEAVKPIKMQRMDNFSYFVTYSLCGNCRYELKGKDVMFCSHCGRAVKRE